MAVRGPRRGPVAPGGCTGFGDNRVALACAGADDELPDPEFSERPSPFRSQQTADPRA